MTVLSPMQNDGLSLKIWNYFLLAELDKHVQGRTDIQTAVEIDQTEVFYQIVTHL